LRRWRPPPIELPLEYRFVGWNPTLLRAHAAVKYQSFRGGIDAQLFPCLVMSAIKKRDGFLPEATWLVEYVGADRPRPEYCGTIQAIRIDRNRASIQNVGVAPQHRGQGLGTALILASLLGPSLLGLDFLAVPRVRLEVTAENAGAVRLYRRLGFRTIRTLYKTVELASAGSCR